MGNKDSGKPDYTGGYWGLATADHDSKKIILSMKYYAMGQFSRYIRPRYYYSGRRTCHSVMESRGEKAGSCDGQ